MQNQTKIIIMFMQIILFFNLISNCYTYDNTTTNNNNLSSWCKKTPYSEQCEYYLSKNKLNTIPMIKEKSHFLNMMIESAIENVNQVHQNALYTINKNFENELEKAVWRDCLEVYELAIEHLNQTITNTKSTKFDTQTWLSSALTLHQTCENGINELGLIINNSNNNFMSLLYNNVNVSNLISNALAINNDGLLFPFNNGSDRHEDGFPNWVRPGDRKLLQSGRRPDLVVAQDGSGDYSSVGQAISGASSKGGSRVMIYVKAGIYRENVDIGLKNVMLLGDGIGKTIITGSRSVGGGATTFRSATVAVAGSGFMAQGITFRNTAGPSNHQAVALRSNSDLSVFYKCSFEGYQDTLYVFTNRQFYRECDIYGTVDYIFGNGAVVFQNCNILTRHPPAGTNTLTAQGRTDPNQNTGIVIQNCRVSAAESQNGAKTYLGRPWQRYSRTVFMKTYMDSIVAPSGWLEWSGNFALSTLYYAEFANTGPGSSTANRVKWPGYHVIGASEAERFTVGNFISGGSWITSTGVPYTSGI